MYRSYLLHRNITPIYSEMAQMQAAFVAMQQISGEVLDGGAVLVAVGELEQSFSQALTRLLARPVPHGHGRSPKA